MEYVIGFLLGVFVGGLATISGLDRDKAFYPTVLIVVASYYVLFAAMGGTGQTIIIETALGSIFLILALLGFKRNLWIVAGGLIAHGLSDGVHHMIVENPGVPHWWPGFCLAIDVAMGVWLAARLMMPSQTPLKPQRLGNSAS